jgi:hypothetical protein
MVPDKWISLLLLHEILKKKILIGDDDVILLVFVINYSYFQTPKNVSLQTFSNCRFYFLCIITWFFCLLLLCACTFSSIHLLLLLLLYIQFTLELNIIIQLYIIYQTDPLLLVLLCCDYIKRRKDKKRGREKNLSLATLLLPFLSLHSKMYNWTKMQLLCESYCTSCYNDKSLKFLPLIQEVF